MVTRKLVILAEIFLKWIYIILIDVEDIDTWPIGAREVLERNFETLKAYEIERQRLLDLYFRDWFAHQYTGGNVHSEAQQAIVGKINDHVLPHDIIGLHCARLCDDEIKSILENGMALPSLDFLIARIRMRAKVSNISHKIVERLLRENLAAEPTRNGKIHFINGSSILRYESGQYRFFRYWGGEALYGRHECDPEIGPILQNLGCPCIVVVSLPISSYQCYRPIGLALYRAFMMSRSIETDGSTGMQGSMHTPVESHRVKRVIRYDDPEFEEFTTCSSWQLKIT